MYFVPALAMSSLFTPESVFHQLINWEKAFYAWTSTIGWAGPQWVDAITLQDIPLKIKWKLDPPYHGDLQFKMIRHSVGTLISQMNKCNWKANKTTKERKRRRKQQSCITFQTKVWLAHLTGKQRWPQSSFSSSKFFWLQSLWKWAEICPLNGRF